MFAPDAVLVAGSVGWASIPSFALAAVLAVTAAPLTAGEVKTGWLDLGDHCPSTVTTCP